MLPSKAYMVMAHTFVQPSIVTGHCMPLISLKLLSPCCKRHVCATGHCIAHLTQADVLLLQKKYFYHAVCSGRVQGSSTSSWLKTRKASQSLQNSLSVNHASAKSSTCLDTPAKTLSAFLQWTSLPANLYIVADLLQCSNQS